MKPGLVYALSEHQLPEPVPVDSEFYIKIGFTTAKSAESRVKGCQTGNPRQLNVVRELKGSQFHEMRLHKLLSRYRQVGEWFLLPGVLVSQIQSNEIEMAHELVKNFEAIGLQQLTGDPSSQADTKKHLHALEVFKSAADQRELAEELCGALEELGDIGELNGLMVLDAMCGSGISFAGSVGEANSAYVMQLVSRAA